MYNYTFEKLLTDTGYENNGLNIWFIFPVVVSIYYTFFIRTTDESVNKNKIYDEQIKSIDPSNITVIGIAGQKRSGKDTSGERLINEYGFIKVAFADSLKDACIEIFGFSYEQVYGDELKEVVDDYWGYSPREVLQKVGTELFRKYISYNDVLPLIGKDIWIRTIERKITNLSKEGHTKFVITDIRYLNELEFLNKSKFKTMSIKIQRQIQLENTNVTNDETKTHISENDIKLMVCDHEITNDGTIEDLYNKIDDIVSSV